MQSLPIKTSRTDVRSRLWFAGSRRLGTLSLQQHPPRRRMSGKHANALGDLCDTQQCFDPNGFIRVA